MYNKLAMTCFRYQVYLYGTITYVKLVLREVTETAL
jgi:hypothetical protein